MKNKLAVNNMGKCLLWLTWKLIRKQKLRTAAIFCGLVFSIFLLGAFGSFGYSFWVEVHGHSGETAGYNQAQRVLVSLVTVLLSLVAGCSGILLHNLYSLTFAQSWRSLTRLTALGASPRSLLAMALLENTIFFCLFALPGYILTALSRKIVGVHSRPPAWLTGSILLWIWALSAQRAELEARPGIQYSSSPRTKAELEKALSECRRLADSSSVIYISMPASASVEADALSQDLRDLLGAAGWPGLFQDKIEIYHMRGRCRLEPFEQIYSSYLKDVYKYVFSLCRDPVEAEEVTQETFCQAPKSMPSFRGGCKLIVWICQIAKHIYYAWQPCRYAPGAASSGRVGRHGCPPAPACPGGAV